MRKTLIRAGGWVLVCLLGSVIQAEQKTQISYSTSDLGNGRWEYEYVVSNLTLTEGIEEFTIWFDYNLYDNLNIETCSPLCSDWDELVWQPEATIGNDGGYDVLGLNMPVFASQSISGFMVSFDWLGNSSEPAKQCYEIIDPITFQTIDSGSTIPEPLTLMLYGLGNLWISRKYNRKRCKCS